jgi:hypothetical protein
LQFSTTWPGVKIGRGARNRPSADAGVAVMAIADTAATAVRAKMEVRVVMVSLLC